MVVLLLVNVVRNSVCQISTNDNPEYVASRWIDVPCIAELVKALLTRDPCDNYVIDEFADQRINEVINATNEGLVNCGKGPRIRVSIWSLRTARLRRECSSSCVGNTKAQHMKPAQRATMSQALT